MLKSVTVTNPKGESLTLTLTKPEESGLAITNITGLGPVKADINITPVAGMDGGIFNSAKRETRNIVIELAMLFSPQIEDARQRTYRYFPVKKYVNLTFETDNRIAETVGYVESNEPSIFNKLEFTQISIICPDPLFYEQRTENTVFSGILPLFEFPFVDDSLKAFGEKLWNSSLLRNYNFQKYTNTKGQQEYHQVGSTINNWEFISGDLGLVWLRLHGDYITLQAYPDPDTDLIWGQYLSLSRGEKVTFSVLTDQGFKSKTVDVPDYDSEDTPLPELELENGFIARIIFANSPREQDCFQIFREHSSDVDSATVNLKAAKVEYGDYQTLVDDPSASELTITTEPKLSKDEGTLIFGEKLLDDRAVLTYSGDADSGALITIHMIGDVENIKLFNVDTGESMFIDTYKIFQITGKIVSAGDDIEISTVPGERFVRFLRSGVYTNIIGAINKDADWFMLSQGDNIFGYTAERGDNNMMITFSYRNAYGGI